jgi:Co/Zn/Cd efflux system component
LRPVPSKCLRIVGTSWFQIIIAGRTRAGALLLAALACTYARKRAGDPNFTFGTGKFGDLAGFTNAIIVAMIALLIAYESVSRLLAPIAIHFVDAIPIACIGLAVSIASAWLLSSGGHHHGMMPVTRTRGMIMTRRITFQPKPGLLYSKCSSAGCCRVSAFRSKPAPL